MKKILYLFLGILLLIPISVNAGAGNYTDVSGKYQYIFDEYLTNNVLNISSIEPTNATELEYYSSAYFSTIANDVPYKLFLKNCNSSYTKCDLEIDYTIDYQSHTFEREVIRVDVNWVTKDDSIKSLITSYITDVQNINNGDQVSFTLTEQQTFDYLLECSNYNNYYLSGDLSCLASQIKNIDNVKSIVDNNNVTIVPVVRGAAGGLFSNRVAFISTFLYDGVVYGATDDYIELYVNNLVTISINPSSDFDDYLEALKNKVATYLNTTDPDVIIGSDLPDNLSYLGNIYQQVEKIYKIMIGDKYQEFVVINPNIISRKSIVYESSNKTVLYNGGYHGIDLNVTTPTNYTIKYADENGDYVLDEMPTYKDPGHYEINYYITAGERYNDIYDLNTIDIIAKPGDVASIKDKAIIYDNDTVLVLDGYEALKLLGNIKKIDFHNNEALFVTDDNNVYYYNMGTDYIINIGYIGEHKDIEFVFDGSLLIYFYIDSGDNLYSNYFTLCQTCNDKPQFYDENDTIFKLIANDVKSMHNMNNMDVKLLYLTNDDELYALGNNGYGTDINNGEYIKTPIKLLDNVSSYDAGWAITKTNDLYIFYRGEERPRKVMENVKRVIFYITALKNYEVEATNNKYYSINCGPESTDECHITSTNITNQIVKYKTISLYNGFIYLDSDKNLYRNINDYIDTDVDDFVIDYNGCFYLKNNKLYHYFEKSEYFKANNMASGIMHTDDIQGSVLLLENVKSIEYYPFIIMNDNSILLAPTYSPANTDIDALSKIYKINDLLNDNHDIEPLQVVISSQGRYGFNVGDEVTFYATVIPYNAINKNVTWASSDESIATVSANGVVNFIGTGVVVITAHVEGTSIASSIYVTSYPLPTGIEITQGDILTTTEERIVLSGAIKPSGTNYFSDFVWTVEGGNAVFSPYVICDNYGCGGVGSNRFLDLYDYGKYTVTLTTEDGRFSDTITIYRLQTKELNNLNIRSIPDQIYTGSAVKPNIEIYDGDYKLVESSNYELSFSNNTEIGTASVTITGIGNYTGTKTMTFNIGFGIKFPNVSEIFKVKNTILIIKGYYNKISTIKNKASLISSLYVWKHFNKNKQEITDDNIKTGDYIQLFINGNKKYEYQLAILGDVNGDGKISALDYVKIKNHIMKTTLISGNCYLEAADLNEDNKISALDYVRVKNYIMNGGK